MKIYLRDDWDVPIHFSQLNDEIIGNFTGRKDELLNLNNEIRRSKTGSILVCGYRGVGKTSFVYKSLNNVKDKDTIIVLLNASQLEAESGNHEINPSQIIENLIKRLYAKTRDNQNLSPTIKNQIYNIYIKSNYLPTDYEILNKIKEISFYEHMGTILIETYELDKKKQKKDIRSFLYGSKEGVVELLNGFIRRNISVDKPVICICHENLIPLAKEVGFSKTEDPISFLLFKKKLA